MDEIQVVRVRQVTVLDESGNPRKAVRVFYRVEGLGETYYLDIYEEEASPDRVKELVLEHADKMLKLYMM